jgi:16S rRNA G966 N2-methylase RsmD
MGKSAYNSMSRYARACVFGEEDKIEIHLEQKQKEKLNRLKIFVEINRIGHNLNQLTKQINFQYAFKAKDLIEELAHIKAELEKIELYK